MNLTTSDLGLLAAPFAVGLAVLVTHVPLGMRVLARGIIFIDLAVAQVAALGVIVAGLLHLEDDWGEWATQAAAGFAAMAAAALLTYCERRWPEIQEALIGLLFVAAAALGILLLSSNPRGGDHLRDLLAGDILWVQWAQLGSFAALTAAVLAGLLLSGRCRGHKGFAFYALFAIAVTASVQLIGVLLVFASLIAPVVATRGLPTTTRQALAFAAGAIGYGLGLAVSLVADLPAGATVVCTLILVAVAGMLYFPADGQSSRGEMGKPT